MYCIVDIETTGTHTKDNKITEIAIIKFDGVKIVETFQSLINPERSIPPFIEKLTGITNELVKNAPKFYEIAKKIALMTEGCTFVAHNVHFDFNFIRHEFADLGHSFKLKKLCTVRLARKVIPGYPSYSLGNICKNLGIENHARHRAMGDAQATLELFKILLAKDSGQMEAMLGEVSEALSFPPHLDQTQYHSLPSGPGVYYLWDKDMQLLYIGKSKNIKARVSQHFKVGSGRAKEMQFKNNIAHITCKITGTDLAAQLLECQEIKNHRPIFNRAMNKSRYPYSIVIKYDQDQRVEFAVTKLESLAGIQVGSKKTAQSLIDKMIRDAFAIGDDEFFPNALAKYKKVLSISDYNHLLIKEYSKHTYPISDFTLDLKGRFKFEICRIFVEANEITKMVYLSDEGEEKILIEENRDSRKILLTYLKKRPKITTSLVHDELSNHDYQQ